MRYYIVTFGCQMNRSDSERIATVLEKIGYEEVSKIDEADLIAVNMCSVRQSAVDRVYGLLPKFQKLKTVNLKLKTILTGCVLKSDRKKFARNFDFILGIKDLPIWPQKLAKKDGGCVLLEQNYLKIIPKYQSSNLAFVPISNGCNNFCAYCVVPFARGPLVCRLHEDILKEIKNLIREGKKEIWLLGQNVNDYQSPIRYRSKSKISSKAGDFFAKGEQIKNPAHEAGEARQRRQKSKIVDFADLLEMINNIPGNFLIRFISPNPKNFSDELIETMAKCEKVAKYLNLPVQSGDDKILKKMNRPYTVKQYKNLVKKIREKIPEINLSTDVIVGFPGETKKQFENTVKLFKEIKFNIAYFAKYSPRPGTAAWRMKDDVSLKEKKRREKILREIIEKQHLPR